jgi:WD40 repeat protein
VAFSHDDLLLATAGYAEDRKLIIWDVSTGHIVTSVTQQPCPTTVLVWAGFVRDIKVIIKCSSSSAPL